MLPLHCRRTAMVLYYGKKVNPNMHVSCPEARSAAEGFFMMRAATLRNKTIKHIKT